MPFLPPDPKKAPYKPPCISPEHFPPSHMVLPAGEHRWECPACKEVITFNVHSVIC